VSYVKDEYDMLTHIAYDACPEAASYADIRDGLKMNLCHCAVHDLLHMDGHVDAPDKWLRKHVKRLCRLWKKAYQL
jgi:hypothetical protein